MGVGKEQAFIEQTQLEWETAGDGVTRAITAYSDALMSVIVHFTKGAVGVLHTHPHTQITYIQTGVFEVSIGGTTQILRGGDFYFIEPDVEHGVVAREDGILLDVFTPMREEFIHA